MASITQHCERELAALSRQDLQREMRVCAPVLDESAIIECENRRYINFASNDYLGLQYHPAVREAASLATRMYAAGAGASRLITGNHPLYAPLEAKLASMKHAQAARVFGSGYLTNVGVIPALLNRGDVIFADKWVHACILDAAQLSGARLLRFRHNDMAHLETLLKGHREESTHALIVTDHVFSMDGDIAPLADIATLAERHEAWTMADDAHGLGLVEPAAPCDIWMGTLSKAAGGYGGYVAGSQALVDYLTSSARSFMFSTGLPPAVCAASLKALEIIEREPERGSIALSLARRVTSALGLPTARSAIVPIILGEAAAALAASEALRARGIWVTAIRPPTVPQGTARLRITISCEHTDAQVDALIAALKEIV